MTISDSDAAELRTLRDRAQQAHQADAVARGALYRKILAVVENDDGDETTRHHELAAALGPDVSRRRATQYVDQARRARERGELG